MKKSKISSYFEKVENKCLELYVSRLVALDGFTFSIFTTSADLRELFAAKGIFFIIHKLGYKELPKNHCDIRNIVLNYSMKIRSLIYLEIGNLKKSGEMFCISFDEWTSSANKKYMTLNIHGKESKFWNLGLIRMIGQYPATKILDLISSKLLELDLTLEKNIISICTDGTSTMKKIGKLSPCNHQLCLAHGVQLAVLDVLYPKIQKVSIETVSQYNQDIVENVNLYSDTDEEEDGCVIIEEDLSINDVNYLDYSPLIQKTRKIVRLFRKSPTKNDEILQKYVKQEMGKELSLILDSKTRWNSLYFMIERFYLLRNPIMKSLIDLKSDILITLDDFSKLKSIIDALGPLKVTIEALCCRNTNLLIADATLKFAHSKLIAQTNNLSQSLAASLEKRIKERRTEFSGLIQYLHSGNVSEENPIFPIPKPERIVQLIKEILDRLYVNDNHDVLQNSADNLGQESTSDIEESVNLKDELYKFIMSSEASSQKPSTYMDTETSIKREMALFDSGNSRGKFLELVYDFILKIPPTTVEAERCFSSSGYICSKLRTRLSDKSLDAICFLRSYFKLNKS